MSQIDQRQKTLVFCATQDHAAMVRDLINQVKKSDDPNYCHRVTADDGAIGEQHLRDFQDNEKTIPTILTTSQKLSTGVDARNIRNIVLMRPINSMIEFKQIIGRGTRTFEGKDFFTIWDFVKAHQNFQDPDWDGEPLEPEDPPTPRPVDPDADLPPGNDGDDVGDDDDEKSEKAIIELASGKELTIRYIATTTYWLDGKIVSPAEFLQRLFGDLSARFHDEDALRAVWSDPEERERFLDQLADQGYERDRLEGIRHLIDAPDSDLFDVLAHILFEHDPKTRAERAGRLSSGSGTLGDGELRTLLASMLEAYVQGGERELRPAKLTHYLTGRYGSVGEGKARLGMEVGEVQKAYKDLQRGLYQS